MHSRRRNVEEDHNMQTHFESRHTQHYKGIMIWGRWAGVGGGGLAGHVDTVAVLHLPPPPLPKYKLMKYNIGLNATEFRPKSRVGVGWGQGLRYKCGPHVSFIFGGGGGGWWLGVLGKNSEFDKKCVSLPKRKKVLYAYDKSCGKAAWSSRHLLTYITFLINI